MEFRCWHLSVLFAVIFSLTTVPCDCAPAFKIKHYNFYKSKMASPAVRIGDRRFIGGNSPIHFISPYVPVSQPVDSMGSFYVPRVPLLPIAESSPSMSNIYKLPLQFLSNGQPHKIIRGFPKVRPQMVDFLPPPESNIIRLPLKFMSNGKPFGPVYIKDRFPGSSINFI